MRFWTVHLRGGSAPVLLREGFSWGAALFGPLWLLSHRAWLPAVLAFCAGVFAAVLPGSAAPVATIALAWLLGLCGRDLLRWSLERRGFLLAHVIAGRDEESAYARLLAARPELAAG